MRHRLLNVVFCIVSVLWLSPVVMPYGDAVDDKDQVLFDFASESAAKDWTPVKLPEVAEEQPAPIIEIAPNAKTKADDGQASKCLKITFAGGDWPAVGTTTIPVQGNWKPFQMLQAEVTVDRPSVAYFRVCQGKPDEKSEQPRWQKTMTLLPGRNEVTLMLRHGGRTALRSLSAQNVMFFEVTTVKRHPKKHKGCRPIRPAPL